MQSSPLNGLNRALSFACWLPIICLAAVEIYVRDFDGWGAWSTAPLFLLPIILGTVISGAGIIQFISELRAGFAQASTAASIAVALMPFLWLLIRRYIL